MYLRFFKVLFDYLITAIALLFSIPVGLIVFLVLQFTGDKEAFFIQMRPGLNGELFPLIKFRSMIDLYDDMGNLLPDEKRLTRLGKILRSTSLDELPQLINVLRGEMSLVGPRPLLPEYLDLYSPHHLKRNEIKPGITGLAQINGRNAVSWITRLDLDVEYVENVSFILDVSIIFTTLLKVLTAKDINAINSNPIPKFSGYH